MDIQILKEVVTEILNEVPSRPFFCLPMSAMLYAVLKDNSLADPLLITGNLSYKEHIIFKQDYQIKEVKNGSFSTWSGHSWVKVDGLIVDLSFFRTLYSKAFTKPFKKELIAVFGQGRGCLIIEEQDSPIDILIYRQIDVLDDELATGILKGYEQL